MSPAGGDYQVCEADGTWLGASPTCVESVCVEPPPLLNGKAQVHKTVQGQISVFSCNLGYNLTGDKETTCSLGHWIEYK